MYLPLVDGVGLLHGIALVVEDLVLKEYFLFTAWDCFGMHCTIETRK